MVGALSISTTDTHCAASLPRSPPAAESRDTINAIISGSIDLEARDASGRTALHIATYAGDIDTVRQLLAKGSSIDALDAAEQSALFVATENGRKQLVEVGWWRQESDKK